MAALSEVLKTVQQHCQQQQAKSEILKTVQQQHSKSSNSSKQVKFAPKPIMISTIGSASLSTGLPPAVDTKAILQSLSTTSSNVTPVTSIQSPSKNGPASVRGMIRVTDDANPRKVKNVLVSMPPKGSTDHTYANLKGKPSVDSSESEDSSSSSESEAMETEDLKMTPPANVKPKQSASTGRARGRPRKPDIASTVTPVENTSLTPQPRSILKTAQPEVKVTYERVRRRGRGCGNCPGCLRDDCGNCCYCLDKPKFGGPGKKKQRCALRVCAHFKSAPGVRNSIHSKAPAVAIPPAEAVKLLTEVTSSTIPLLKRVEPVPLKHTPTPQATTSTPTAVSGTSPTQTPTSSAATTTTPAGRTKVAGMIGDEMIKCVMCGRERKLSMARSNKFCGGKCLKDWEAKNPGKSPEMAERSSNHISLPCLLQAALDKPAVPRALKNLQIDMALPGERRHDPISLPVSGSPELLEIAPYISSISGSASSEAVPTSTPELSGIKRSSHENGATPSKRAKTMVTSPVSSSPSPIATATPVISTGSKTNKKSRLNPAEVSKWSISDVVKYFESTGECSHIAPILQEQEVDGEALLLLSHDSLVKCLGMKLGPALKVMTHVDRLKSQASLSY